MKVRTLLFVPGAIEKLETILDWVGLTPDEGKNFTIKANIKEILICCLPTDHSFTPDPSILKDFKNGQLSNFRIFDEKTILFYCI